MSLVEERGVFVTAVEDVRTSEGVCCGMKRFVNSVKGLGECGGERNDLCLVISWFLGL